MEKKIKLEGLRILTPLIHKIKRDSDYFCSDQIFEYGSSEADPENLMTGEVSLISTTIEELGLDENSTWEQILAQAEKSGLRKCPAEVGPRLRTQFDEQEPATVFLIGMEPLEDEGLYMVRRHLGKFAEDGKMYLSVISKSSESIRQFPILFVSP